MHGNVDLILTLTGGLGAALVLGFFTQRLGLSPIAGYLLAGVVVGPFTPGFVAHAELAEQMAELGVVLLMFGVGLHFRAGELIAVRKVAIPGALAQIAVSTALGALLGHAFGWSLGAGLVFGMAISVASTVVLLRVLGDHGVLHTRSGHVAVGWLIVEDLFTVLTLVLLPTLARSHGSSGAGAVLLATGIAFAKIGLLVAFTAAIGRRALPALLEYVSKTRSRELFTLAVLVVALGISVGSAKFFGVSMALGAFLAGMIVGQSPFGNRAASDALPMRDAFAVLFFVSIGMLFDPKYLTEHVSLILATLAIILVGKPLAAFVVVSLLRYPLSTAFSVSVALAQIGEFSFILAALGRELGILPEAARQTMVAASIISITLNPLLFRLVRSAERRLRERNVLAAKRLGEDETTGDAPSETAHTIVVGYGPIGRMVTNVLMDQQIVPTVIELSYETVQALEACGVPAVYGDASQPMILERAGIRRAGTLIYAGADPSAGAVIQAAKELHPQLQIVARTTYLRETSATQAAGAHVVVTAEAEVALAMAECVLGRLGASGEQRRRSRDRILRELADGMTG